MCPVYRQGRLKTYVVQVVLVKRGLKPEIMESNQG